MTGIRSSGHINGRKSGSSFVFRARQRIVNSGSFSLLYALFARLRHHFPWSNFPFFQGDPPMNQITMTVDGGSSGWYNVADGGSSGWYNFVDGGSSGWYNVADGGSSGWYNVADGGS